MPEGGTVAEIAHHEHIPPGPEMVWWIQNIVERGIRRPGYTPDRWTVDWAEAFFLELGLSDVTREPVVLPYWEPRSWLLEIWPVNAPDEMLEPRCFPVPLSAPAFGGVEGPVVVVGDGDVSGAMALDTVTLTRFRQTTARDLAMRAYDPDLEFETLTQVLPFGRQMQNVMEPAIDAGARAFIGVFDAPWDTCDYYVPYDAVERPIPGVWISRSDGERVREMLAGGPVFARMTVDSKTEPVETHNLIGSLPGASEEWVIVACHHDGPWTSAVEDAGGVALVLAQAAYWSRVPQLERPHNMLFLLTSGHMSHGAGTRAFIASHRQMLDRVVLEMHLEHPARECVGENGRLIPTDNPEVRWWFTSRNDALIDAVEAALRAEDLRRSLVMPPDVFGPHPTTDGGFFHLEGVPLVNFLTAPMYLFDSQDTMDKIHVSSLDGVTRAAIRILNSTRGVSAAEMRAGVTATP